MATDGEWLAAAARPLLLPGQVLVPVPLHWTRLLRRRHNQAQLLAAEAGRHLGLPVLPDALVRRRATQSLLDREEELVAGYAEIGYAGLVTVSARTLDELEEDAEIVEQLARESGMELRCLDGRQDTAWAAALPLGLAPRTLLA